MLDIEIDGKGCTEFGIAKESVKELLENKIGCNIEVKKSDMPIRF